MAATALVCSLCVLVLCVMLGPDAFREWLWERPLLEVFFFFGSFCGFCFCEKKERIFEWN